MPHFIDYPVYVDREEYDHTINRMIDRLKKIEGIVSIYQMGNVRTPGISDIDIIAIFKDGVSCRIDPRAYLTKKELYLFVHGVFGISESNFSNAQKYTYFHNYKCLLGTDIVNGLDSLNEHKDQLIRNQTAMEYLLKMFISLTIQRTYGIYKIRSLLLEIKALVYDFEFLGITNHKLLEVIDEVDKWRTSWFINEIDNNILNKWLDEFHKELFHFIETLFQQGVFYIANKDNCFPIAHNIFIKQDNQFDYSHTGYTFPSFLGILGRKLFNLQHRFNKFTFHVPFEKEEISSELKNYFSYLQEIKKYNNRYLPYFQSLSSSLNI